MQQTNKQTNKQFFKIHIKPNARPFEAIKGKVVDNEIQGQETKVFIDPPITNIHNFYNHLVVRELDKNGRYHGKIKFVDSYESEDGEAVESMEIRYIANCPSLDKQWQNENKYKPKDAKAYHGWDYPSNSIQEFDTSKEDKLFIEFLKHHQGNGTHKGRDANNGILFVEVDSVRNVSNKKEKFEQEKQKLEFIESIHTKDEVVNIYAIMLGIRHDYDIESKRDEVLSVAEKMTAEGLMKEVEVWKGNYKFLLDNWFEEKKITTKDGKVYSGKNPQPFFKDESLTSINPSGITKEIVNSVFKSESMYLEFQRLNKSIK
jgi:hypothetical protein